MQNQRICLLQRVDLLLQGFVPLFAGVGFHGVYDGGGGLVGAQCLLRLVLRGEGVAQGELRLEVVGG